MPLVEIENLQLELAVESGRIRVLDGVDLRLEPGRVHALVGESGSGKSITAIAPKRDAPSNGSASTSDRLPPCSSTIFLTIGKPSPVPLARVVT